MCLSLVIEHTVLVREYNDQVPGVFSGIGHSRNIYVYAYIYMNKEKTKHQLNLRLFFSLCTYTLYIHSHSLNKYLMTPYYIQHTIFGSGDTVYYLYCALKLNGIALYFRQSFICLSLRNTIHI